MSDINIYVACLACYNEGTLHGTWIDATQSPEEIDAERATLQEQCGHTDNDWAIHDHEGFEGIKLGESESFATVSALAQAIEEHGDAFAVWYGNENRDEVDVEAFREAYQGSFNSLEDWAEQFLDDTGALAEIPSSLRCYFDFEAWARDAEMNGDMWSEEKGGQVHVFFNT